MIFDRTGFIKPTNIIKHFKTVSLHRELVRQNCFRAGIYIQGLTHDLSKFSPTEFWMSCAMYQGNRSPNEAEREKFGYSTAWMHHKGRNRHHFEYWTDYNPATRQMEPAPMPLKYVAEMFCDRVAASKVYMKEKYTDASPLAYFEKGRNSRLIHPKTSHQLEMLLTMLAEHGEEYTFAFIRHLLRNYK